MLFKKLKEKKNTGNINKDKNILLTNVLLEEIEKIIKEKSNVKIAESYYLLEEEENEKFDGALVANPENNDYTGAWIMGERSKYVRANVVDFDHCGRI